MNNKYDAVHSDLAIRLNVKICDNDDVAIEVTGAAMLPEFKPGDYVYLKPMPNKDLIYWGETYVIVTDCFKVLRKILPFERKGVRYYDTVVLRATNPDPAYDADIRIYLDQIEALYLVMAKTTIYNASAPKDFLGRKRATI